MGCVLQIGSGNVIVLVVDRLGSGFLGPYGNTWLETPVCNRLAAESLLVEWSLAESLDLTDTYTSYWSGQSRLVRGGKKIERHDSWLERLNRLGIKTWLLTDDEPVAYHPLAGTFQQRDFVPQDDRLELADQPDETALVRSFARWLARLETIEPPFLTWIHCRGMQGAWDAPWEYRLQVSDPDDPSPPTSAQVPCGNPGLPSGSPGHASPDPDELWGLTCAYAAQVMLLDECLEMLLGFLETQPWGDDTTVILTAPRGFPLGEHGLVGDNEDGLFAEAVQVPLLLRAPRCQGVRPGQLRRWPCLVQPWELGNWIASGSVWQPDWFESELIPSDDRDASRLIWGPHRMALRTPHWHYITERPLTTEAVGQLYVKPDDRWDYNDVSDRATQEVQDLHAELRQRMETSPP